MRCTTELGQCRAQRLGKTFFDDNDPYRAVGEDVGVSRDRGVGINRHIGGTSLENAVDRGDRVNGFAQVESDPVPRARSQLRPPTRGVFASFRKKSIRLSNAPVCGLAMFHEIDAI
jgi:hypothetical protein